MRYLLIVVVAILVWLAVRVLTARRERPDVAPDVASAAKAIEQITQCAWCGVHVPSGTAIVVPDGRIYCGEAHRDAARAAADRAS